MCLLVFKMRFMVSCMEELLSINGKLERHGDLTHAAVKLG
jgi:hypothetical protein